MKRSFCLKHNINLNIFSTICCIIYILSFILLPNNNLTFDLRKYSKEYFSRNLKHYSNEILKGTNYKNDEIIIKKRLNLSINDYKEYFQLYSPIEIELYNIKSESKFINISNKILIYILIKHLINKLVYKFRNMLIYKLNYIFVYKSKLANLRTRSRPTVTPEISVPFAFRRRHHHKGVSFFWVFRHPLPHRCRVG